ncbi:MAG: DUF4232 domain-containing protein [Actinomycetota bacterium]
MNEIDDQIRDLLRDKADEVPPHGSLPRPLSRRIRRRITLNAVAVTMSVFVIGVGAFAGVRALRAPGAPEVIKPASSPTAQQSPSVAPIVACTAEQLQARGSLQGAAGSREGSIEVLNRSDASCTLKGSPTITLTDGKGNPITSGVIFGLSPAAWEANGSPEPSGWPVVTVAPDQKASVRIRWSNWCIDGGAAPGWRMQIPHGSAIDVAWAGDVTPPPCNGPSQPSTIDVGPFEEG